MRSRGSHQAAASIPDAEVRSELERVAASDSFQRSPQLQRFLRFVVEEVLSGRGDKLKEYVVGTEVFGRPANYDPQLDSLVRVEAHRLRAALDDYYRDKGSSDSVLIELTKGSYAPSFQHRASPQAAAPSVTSPPGTWMCRKWPWVVLSATLAMALLAAWLYRFTKPLRLQTLQDATIAVLPFDNLSADPENAYFCFGLMDEVTTELAKTGELRVVARTSSAQFKRGDDIATIGRQLKAGAVLEGSVQKSTDRVRITAQLINTADSLHLWSQSYERPIGDLLRVQTEIAQEITREVHTHLTGKSGKEPRRAQYSANSEANQLYWKGAFFRSPIGKTGWRKDLAASAEYLERAVQKDPQFGLAYAALADVYVSQGWERGGGPVTSDYMTRGRKAAVQALELDSTLGEAYGALGTVQFFYDYDGPAAERSFQRALQLDPSNGKARMWYALALVVQRRSDEAIAQARQATELDPLSYVATTHLAVITFLSRRNNEAIRLARQTLELADIAPAHGLLGMAYEVQRDYGAAIDEYQAALRLVPNHSYIKGMLGHAYAMSGRTQDAIQLLSDANAGFEQGGLSDLRAAYVYAGLGDRESVFRHLESAYDQRDPDLPYINVDPVFDPVRSAPRFCTLLRKMGLSK